jgi:hypothetical protein
MQQKTEQLRTLLMEKILDCIDGTTSKETILEISTSFTKETDIQSDLPLLQSVTILDFFAKQIANGNDDVITKKLEKECYTYILNNLMSTVQHPVLPKT